MSGQREAVAPMLVRELPVAPPTVSIWFDEATKRSVIRAALPFLAFLPAATLLTTAAVVFL